MIGMSITTSQSQVEHSQVLWSSFMPRKKEIADLLDNNLYSIQIYPSGIDFGKFNTETPFQKWAAVEVKSTSNIPEGMKSLNIPKGEYAIFIHHGPARSFPKTAQYIFGMWLPNSIYEFDDRPQFEVMSPDYLGPEHEDAQEEVWIPFKRKANDIF